MSTSEQSTKPSDARGPTPVRERSCYDVLEVTPNATREEIEAAYRRALRIIEGNSLGGYLMLDPEARESAKREVERAFQVLTNPQERARVDRELGGEREPRENQADKGGRRARRRRKREAARRARAERMALESSPPVAADAPTLPARPALDEDVDEQAVTVITSAEAEPILEDDPLELPPAAPVPSAEPTREPAAKPVVVTKPSPPPLPTKSKKPRLRFLSPVVESTPTPSAPPRTAPAPAPSPAERAVEPPPLESARGESQPPTSRKPWLYSDAGSEAVAEPRVIARASDGSGDDEMALPPESEINGGVIRRLREARGISLDELAEQTHIRKSYLKAIEEQNLDELPARVYLRGFLTQIARVLKVDKKRLAEGYMSFVGRFGK